MKESLDNFFFWGDIFQNIKGRKERVETNSYLFCFTHSTGCRYFSLELHFHLPLLNTYTCSLEHTPPGEMWEYLFIRQRPAVHLVTARDGGVGSGHGVQGEKGKGLSKWARGPVLQALQPAHSNSYSSRATAGMSPHVRDYCLKGGLLLWLKGP